MRQTIDSLVQARLVHNGPGAAIGVLRGGDLLHCQGYGLASLEWNVPIRPDTVFRIASLTKQFTAMAILILQTQGRLHIEDHLTAYLPDCPPAWHNITLKHLLTHTSGLVNVAELPVFQDQAARHLTIEEVIALFRHLPLLFEPGTNFCYGNSGYHLLGLIVERVTGIDYERFIRQAILEPLGMHHSYFQCTTPIIPNRASGYINQNDTIIPAPFTSSISTHSSGAMESTLEDLLIWEQALHNHTLIDADTQQLMFTPVRLADGRCVEYGFGWSFSKYRGKTLACHGGWANGFRSLITRFIEDNLTILILTNYREFSTERVALEIAAQYISFPTATYQTLSRELVEIKKIVGHYDMPGSRIEVVEQDQRILLRKGAREVALFPISENIFIAETDHDVVYHFTEERDGAFHSLVINYPLHFSIATRNQTTYAS
ncbi:serine hydrolase domain-containing protein [Dictyobacter aurantiacus]|uniref:Serine hydrolase n=1 Tax=Dictyobacter aurantiacus TaxID=1936993 RepID=A0A401ZPZ7_9CHLR|nr:serine hydrolase domain-containing protein [Dictyobacter aurantiacus]GCE08902.1 serine hydrolase [Dictyobacter aurantiacus]